MKPYIVLTHILLICAAVLLGGTAIYKFTATPDESAIKAGQEATRPSTAPSNRSKSEKDYQRITQRNLFQTASDQTKRPALIDISNLEQTELKLKLWGTVTGSDGKTWAVIEESEKNTQQLYKEGETIQDATIRQILRNKVVLNLRGKDEVLEIEEITSKIARKPPPARRTTARRRTITIRRTQIEKVVGAQADITQQAQLDVHSEGGTASGIKITSIKPRSIFRQMRLINGDVLLEINGTRFTSPQDVVRLYQLVQNESNVTLQIMRRGRPRTIQYRIR